MSEFNLSNHVAAIREMANANKVTVEVAFQFFVANLATMSDFYHGAPATVDFRALGQVWNSLSSEERNAQKEQTRKALHNYTM